jgi:hydroxymethylpyrimidine kinase/phosphomethylpyrimidine kinase
MGKYPVVLTIAGSDSGGGAGIQADLKTFAALGVHGTSALTSITSQNTTGVINAFDMPVAIIESQIRAVANDMDIAYAKTGMLSSSEIITKVAELVREYKIPLIIDPVMAAEAGGSLLKSDAVKTLKEELIPLATIITPNIHEAEVLSGLRIHDMEDAKESARSIVDSGANAVIITGGHLDGTDLLYDNSDFTLIEGELVEGGTHGAGCTYSAALTVFLAQGATLKDAAAGSKLFVTRAIIESRPVGKGVGPVNPIWHVLETAQRYEAILDVKKAANILELSKDFVHLIPEVGCNIASAIPHASEIDQVCALDGRIIRSGSKVWAAGCPAFGASRHVAKIVLAAMHHNRDLRGAVNIRYSDEILNVINGLGLTVATFDRKHEPSGVSTMEWGTNTAIESYKKTHHQIPDVIFDLGGVGKEPMIRIISHRAVDAAERAVLIGRELAGLK